MNQSMNRNRKSTVPIMKAFLKMPIEAALWISEIVFLSSTVFFMLYYWLSDILERILSSSSKFFLKLLAIPFIAAAVFNI